jgi:hypothetical protein
VIAQLILSPMRDLSTLLPQVWNQTLLSKKRWDLWSKETKSDSGPSRMGELRAKIENE